jgi:hypothetical protein
VGGDSESNRAKNTLIENEAAMTKNHRAKGQHN